MQEKQRAESGNEQVQGVQPYDFSYVSFNSIYRNRSTTMANKLIFSIVAQSDSIQGVSGVTKMPS